MAPKIRSTCLAVLLACLACARLSAQEGQPRETGISVSQLQGLAKALPPLPGTIQAIQFLREDGFWIDRAAILTQGEDSGWQILVLRLESTGRFSPEWSSGKLADSFAVSSAQQFHTRIVGVSEQTLEFSGCAAHNCPDAFSVMLYVPSKRTAFTANYVFGKVTYSPGLEFPANRAYKDSLDRMMKEYANASAENKARDSPGNLEEKTIHPSPKMIAGALYCMEGKEYSDAGRSPEHKTEYRVRYVYGPVDPSVDLLNELHIISYDEKGTSALLYELLAEPRNEGGYMLTWFNTAQLRRKKSQWVVDETLGGNYSYERALKVVKRVSREKELSISLPAVKPADLVCKSQ